MSSRKQNRKGRKNRSFGKNRYRGGATMTEAEWNELAKQLGGIESGFGQRTKPIENKTPRDYDTIYKKAETDYKAAKSALGDEWQANKEYENVSEFINTANASVAAADSADTEEVVSAAAADTEVDVTPVTAAAAVTQEDVTPVDTEVVDTEVVNSAIAPSGLAASGQDTIASPAVKTGVALSLIANVDPAGTITVSDKAQDGFKIVPATQQILTSTTKQLLEGAIRGGTRKGGKYSRNRKNSRKKRRRGGRR